MAIISRELIQDGRLLKRERVSVSELGCDVIITELPAGDVVGIDKKAGLLDVLVRVIVGEDGKRVFGENDQDYLGKNLPLAVATKLVDVSMKLSSLDGKEKN